MVGFSQTNRINDVTPKSPMKIQLKKPMDNKDVSTVKNKIEKWSLIKKF